MCVYPLSRVFSRASFREPSLHTPSQTTVMAENGAEKRKADEMTADSVEVPLAELKELAEKGGEQKGAVDHARTYRHAHERVCSHRV